ncbi:MAG: hypothetical protein ACR2RB_05515, partial [Gammaproteobacteria bacterium]
MKKTLLLALLFFSWVAHAAPPTNIFGVGDAPLTQTEVIPDWQTGETIEEGTERVAPRVSDGALRLWRSGSARTTGADFDATEEAEWTDLGAYTPPPSDALPQHSAWSGYRPFDENLGELTITDGTHPLGFVPRLKSTHVAAAVGPGDGLT